MRSKSRCYYIYSYIHIACCAAWVMSCIPAFPQSSPMWRIPENSGVVCLYTHLKVRGVQCNFEELINLQISYLEKHNKVNLDLRGLIYIAETFGHKITPRNLSMKELATIDKPIIIHIDGGDTGAFMVVVDIGINYVDMINGSNAAIQRMDMTDFRRLWNGLVLLDDRGGVQEIVWSVLSTILISVVANYSILEYIKKRNTI